MTPRSAIEINLLYGSLERTLADGLRQTWVYADACAAEVAHLVIFAKQTPHHLPVCTPFTL
jgi:hypothetical protein